MKIKLFFIALLLGVSFTKVDAQKIGHCNLELILRNMPETAAMEQEINTYRQKYSEMLSKKEQYMQVKYEETMQLMQQTPPAITEEEAKKREEDIMKLQKELKDDAARYERDLGEKQEKMLSPIIEKLKKAIDEIADAESYTYVLNSMDASGTSIVLKGPKENDLTEKVVTKLGIKLQEAPKAPTTAPAAGGKQ